MPTFGGETAESYYDEGLTASMRGDLEQAIKFFERAIKMDSTMAAAYHQLGKVYHRLGNPKKAVAFISQVVQNRPHQIPPRLDLAAATLATGEADRALDLYRKIAAEKPENARAHLGIAQCAFDQGRWEEALLEANRTIELGAATFGAYFLAGRSAKILEQIDDMEIAFRRAQALLDKAIESSPDAPESYYLRGELHYVRGDYPKALDQYRAAEDRAQPGKHYAAYGEHFNLLDILARRGLCLKQLDRPDAAREIGEQILKSDPEHPAARALLS